MNIRDKLMFLENANSRIYAMVTLLGKPMIYTEARLDRDTVPEGLYMYELRYSEEHIGEPVQLGRSIHGNYLGAVISAEPVDLSEIERIDNATLDIDPERDWHYVGGRFSLKEYMAEHPPKAQNGQEKAGKQKPRDRGDDR